MRFTPSGLEPVSRAVRLIKSGLQPFVRAPNARDHVCRPVKVRPSPVGIPIGRWAHRDVAKIADFIGQLHKLCTMRFCRRLDDLESLALRHRSLTERAEFNSALPYVLPPF